MAAAPRDAHRRLLSGARHVGSGLSGTSWFYYSVGRGKGRGKHNREEVHGIPDPKWFMIEGSERGLAYGVFVGIRAPMFFPKIQGSPPSGGARQSFTALPCSCKIEG